MDLSGQYVFNAEPTRVWDLLMNTDVLASCVPGCTGFVPAGDDRYTVTLAVALAAITGTYTGVVSVRDKVPPTSYTLVVEGEGRPGFVHGSAAIALRPDAATTIIDVTATVQTGGAIARLGQRLMGGIAKMMMDQFFACLKAKAGAASSA